MRRVLGLLCAMCVATATAISGAGEREYTLHVRVLDSRASAFTTSAPSTSTTCSWGRSTATCSSYDTSFNWQHVQNSVIIEASDGKQYLVGCTASFRWSKCVQLRPGDTYNARWTGGGLAIQYYDNKRNVKEATYKVYQSRVTPDGSAGRAAQNSTPVSERERGEAGIVNISAVPTLADVRVDGADVGQTPAKLSLNPGSHTIEIIAPGHHSWSKQITVLPSSEVRLQADLIKAVGDTIAADATQNTPIFPQLVGRLICSESGREMDVYESLAMDKPAGRVKCDEVVTVLGAEEQSCRKIRSSGGIEGYIFSRYLKVTSKP